MNPLCWEIIAALSFLGTHFVLSHPLRGPLVARVGEGGFLVIYSLVAFATLGWLVFAYRAVPAEAPCWAVGDGLWITGTVLTYVASVLFVGSLFGNPALPGPPRTGAPPEPRGVFSVTRHPMMWGFALWGVSHILVFPTPSNIVLAGSIVVLALVGAGFQDAKKRQLQPQTWPAWEAKTSYMPLARSWRVASNSVRQESSRLSAGSYYGWARPGRTCRSSGSGRVCGAGYSLIPIV